MKNSKYGTRKEKGGGREEKRRGGRKEGGRGRRKERGGRGTGEGGKEGKDGRKKGGGGGGEGKKGKGEEKKKKNTPENEFHEMISFNEAIEELWIVSLKRFDNKVSESRNWFIGILGHDLRNPLTAISGVQSIIKLSPNISEKERSLLGRAGSSVKRMAELIDNLLELTNLRLGSGMTINKKPVDLSRQGEKIVQELQLSYPEAELNIESPGPVEGSWDVIRLDQLMTNLITNALRHGKPGGPVTIRISAKDNDASLEVHNDGPLIPEKIQDMISTGKFTKTSGDPTNNDSYGLGLYIIKAIVDGHKGKMKVVSSKESGTIFKIILPRFE